MLKERLRLADSRIIGATVFSDAAHVTRRATFALERGLERVAIKNLPRDLDPGAVRIGINRGAVRSVESDEVSEKVDEVSDAVALRRAVEALEGKLWRLTGEREALGVELDLIDRVLPNANGSSPAPLRPESFLGGLDLLMARRRSALAKLRDVELELARTREELAEGRRRAGAVGATAGSFEKRSLLVVSLEVDEPGEHVLDLTYESVWATWRPYYHVRLDPKDRSIECARFADIWQETGEDWNEVALRLSTAEPEMSLLLPTVLPWSLGTAKSYQDKLGDLYKQRRPAKPAADAKAPPKSEPLADEDDETPEEVTSDLYDGTVEGALPPPARAMQALSIDLAMPAAAKGGFPGFARTRSAPRPSMPPPPPMAAPQPKIPGRAPIVVYEPEQKQIRQAPPDHPDREQLLSTPPPRELSGGIDHELEVDGLATCPSGKERRRIGFASVIYPARIEYLLRPAIRDHAFGRVTVINSENNPLIAGPASIFVGEAFFGETKIRTTPAGGKLILDLGAETAIKSARRTKTTVRTEGILTKEDVHVVEATIEIENHLDQIAELEVQDQVPISQDPRVKVRLMRTAPKDAELDELTGILTFKLKLSPATRAEVSIVYEIEAPKDYELHQTLKDESHGSR